MRLLLDAFSRLVWTVENPEETRLRASCIPLQRGTRLAAPGLRGLLKEMGEVWALEGLFVQGFGVRGTAGGSARGGQEVVLRCAAGWHW